jgi:hypothetical protein
VVLPIVAQINEFKKILIGQSAWDIEKLWWRMYLSGENALGGTLYIAMSVIDIALYDMVAKKLNVPVYQLPSYRWGNIPRTAEAYARRTRELIAQGATAGKYDPFGGYPGPERQLSTSRLNEVREMIRGIREGGSNFSTSGKSPCRRRTSTPWRRCSARPTFPSPPGKGCSATTPFARSCRNRPRGSCSRTWRGRAGSRP